MENREDKRPQREHSPPLELLMHRAHNMRIAKLTSCSQTLSEMQKERGRIVEESVKRRQKMLSPPLRASDFRSSEDLIHRVHYENSGIKSYLVEKKS